MKKSAKKVVRKAKTAINPTVERIIDEKYFFDEPIAAHNHQFRHRAGGGYRVMRKEVHDI